MEFFLDHFAVSIPHQSFQTIKPLTDSIPHTVHTAVKTNLNTIEGIYIFTQQGQYIEFLGNRKEKFHFIALNSETSPNIDPSLLPNPNHEKFIWRESEVVTRPASWNEDPPEWFTRIDLIPKHPNFYHPDDVGKIFAWFMNYQHQVYNNVYRVKNGEKVPIGGPDKTLLSSLPIYQINKVTFEVHPYYFDLLPELLSWFPINLSSDANMIRVSTNNPNGEDIIFQYSRSDSGKFGIRSLELTVDDGHSFEHLKPVGPISFEFDGTILSLSFDDYW